MLLALRKYREQESETPSVFKSLADGPPRTFLPAADILRVKCTVRRGMCAARDGRCHAPTIEAIAGRPACRGCLLQMFREICGCLPQKLRAVHTRIYSAMRERRHGRENNRRSAMANKFTSFLGWR
jgi:hypothetical protein